MSKNLFITLPWDKSYTLLVAPISGRFAVDQNHVGFDLQPATTESLGGVIVGDNLVITDSGRLSAVGEGVAGVSSFNNRVGKIDLTEKDVSDALGFRPTNYKLPVATEQTLGGVKQGKNVTIAQDGSISVPDVPTPYSLPIAAKDTLGGVKVGRNLTVDPDGTLNAEGGGGTAGVTTFNGRKGDVKLTKKDVTDVVSIPDPYDLPVASEKSLGGIKVGYNLEIKDDGTLNALDQKYSLPPATVQTLGGIIVGDNLSIDANGRLSATGGEGGGVISFNGRTGRVNLTSQDLEEVQEIATKSSLGVIKVGRNLTINPDGTLDADDQGGGEAGVSSFNGRKGDVTLTSKDVADVFSLPVASNRTLGGIKVGSGLSVTQDGTLSATGGGQGASHRYFLIPVLKDEIPHDKFQVGDLNGCVTYMVSGETAVIVTLDEETADKSKAGDVITIEAAGSYGIILSTSMRHFIAPIGKDKSHGHLSLPEGEARLVNLGTFDTDDYGATTFWGLSGDTQDVSNEFEIAAPELLTAVGGDGCISITWKNREETLPIQSYYIRCYNRNVPFVSQYVDGKETSATIKGLQNLEKYEVSMFAYIGDYFSSDESNILIAETKPDIPAVLTLDNADGIYDGVKCVFTLPEGYEYSLTKFKALIGDTEYDLTDVQDNSLSKKGFVHGLASAVADITVIGITDSGVRVKSNTLKDVEIGAHSVVPYIDTAGGGGYSLRPFVTTQMDLTGVKSIELRAKSNSHPTYTCEIKPEMSLLTFGYALPASTEFEMSMVLIYELGRSQESNVRVVKTGEENREPPLEIKYSSGNDVTPPRYDSPTVQIIKPEFDAQRIGMVVNVNGRDVVRTKDSYLAVIPSDCFTSEPFHLYVAFNLANGDTSDWLDYGMVSAATRKPSPPSGTIKKVMISPDMVKLTFPLPKDLPLQVIEIVVTPPDERPTLYRVEIDATESYDWTYKIEKEGEYSIKYRVANTYGMGAFSAEQKLTLNKIPLPKPPKSLEINKDDKDASMPWVRIIPSGEGTYGDKFPLTVKLGDETVFSSVFDYTKIQQAFQIKLTKAIAGTYKASVMQQDTYGQNSPAVSVDYVIS